MIITCKADLLGCSYFAVNVFIQEADLKWERDFLMGKLLEKDARSDFHTEKMQDQMTLVSISL